MEQQRQTINLYTHFDEKLTYKMYTNKKNLTKDK